VGSPELRGPYRAGGKPSSRSSGYIIGGSIFILPRGPGRTDRPRACFLSYLIAAGLALFVCFVAAQIGSAFPMSGGSYVAVSYVVSPFWGFMVVWMSVPHHLHQHVPPSPNGLVDYLAAYAAPSSGSTGSRGAVLAIVLFTGVNLLGRADGGGACRP